MKRQKFSIPLLIGGATTSPKHTAIKIAPEYEEPIVRVRDASKVAQIVGALLNKEKKKGFSTENHRKQERLRVNFGNKTKDSLLSKEEAYKKRLRLDWKKENIAIPSFLGLKQIVELPIEEIRPYIDWTFFFKAWQMRGSYPSCLLYTSPSPRDS